MRQDPLLAALLDLDSELAGKIDLIVGGGYGLYLKQMYLKENRGIQTLFPIDNLPPARTTHDIDFILRAEVVTDWNWMRPIRSALDRLSFHPVKGAEYMQFAKSLDTGTVKIDLLAGPLGQFENRVYKAPRRVKPRPRVGLHAHRMPEAVAVEEHPLRIPISGLLSSGEPHQTTVLIPQAFSYLLMKLTAFRDRLHDEDKELGRHHAIDIYRIVGLLTKDEDRHVRELYRRFSEDPFVVEARDVAKEHFLDPEGIGRIRIREHQLATPTLDLDRFAFELRGMFASEDSDQ